MSRQRSSTSTSGRSSQSSTSRSTATTATPPTSRDASQQGELQGGGLGGQETTGMVEQAKEKTQQLAGQVQQQATQRVESGLTRGKSQAAQTLNVLADSLINTGQQLRERDQLGIGNYVDQAADRVQRVANYLQNTDVSEVIDRTEEFARRRPAVFLGGAFALGLLGARFLKSSKRQGGGWSAEGGGARGGQGASRERATTGFEQEVPTSRPQQEWAAGGANVSGLADVGGADVDIGQESQSGSTRQRGPLDYGLPLGGPDAAQH